MATYIGYARVSGTKQDNRKQEIFLRARAKELDMSVQIIPEKKSGATLDRQVKEIIATLRSGDILGFWITSRFGRPEPQDIGTYFEWAKEARLRGASIEISKNVLDTTTIEGAKKFFDELLSAYVERMNIAEWTTFGKFTKRNDGLYRGAGFLPFGFRKGVVGHDENEEPIFGYEHHPEQAAIVRELYSWIIAGRKLHDFMDALNRRGDLKTKRGKTREWTKGSLQYILFQPLNMGRVLKEAGRTRLKTKNHIMANLRNMDIFVSASNHPPIVEAETYWQGVETYTNNRRNVYTNNTKAGEDSFTRTVYCRYCYRHGRSSPLVHNHAKKGDKTKAYYRANNPLQGCPNYKTLRAANLRAMFDVSLDILFQDNSETDLYISDQLERIKDHSREFVIRQLDDELAEVEAAKEKWKQALKRAPNTEILDAWLSNLEQLERKGQEIIEKKVEVLSHDKTAEVLQLRSDFHRLTWLEWQRNDISDDQRREIKAKVLKKSWLLERSLVFIFKNSKVVSFRLPFQAPGFRPKPHYPVSIGFMGKLQLVGSFDFDNMKLNVEPSTTLSPSSSAFLKSCYSGDSSSSATNKPFVSLKVNRRELSPEEAAGQEKLLKSFLSHAIEDGN